MLGSCYCWGHDPEKKAARSAAARRAATTRAEGLVKRESELVLALVAAHGALEAARHGNLTELDAGAVADRVSAAIERAPQRKETAGQ